MSIEKTADDAAMDDVFSTSRDRGPEKVQTAEPERQVDLEAAITEAVDASRTVPLKTLTGEREKYKGLLTEAEKRALVAEERLKFHLEQQERSTRQPPAPQRQVQVPDVFNDPEGYARYVESAAAQRLETERLHNSEARARDKFGDEAVSEAFQAAKQAGLIDRHHFVQADPRHPWGELMKWHAQQKKLAALGDDDIDTFKKKIEDEIRAKLASEGKAGGTVTPGAPPQRFPGTLADSTAAGPQGAHLTEEAAMASVFSSTRNRRK